MLTQNTPTTLQEGAVQAQPGEAGQNTPNSLQEGPIRAERNRPISYNPNNETKTVKLWGKEFVIPSHMDMAGMIEVWKNEADSFESLAKDIVENNPRFAWEITSCWLTKHHRLLGEDTSVEGEEENQAAITI